MEVKEKKKIKEVKEVKEMRTIVLLFLILTFLSLTACSDRSEESVVGGFPADNTPGAPASPSSPVSTAPADTLAMLAAQIQRCSRLYTAEYRVHKIMACESNRQIEGMGLRLGLDIFGDRKIIIPMDATLKGYIDLSRLSPSDIERQGNRLTVTLPDPRVMMTSTKIDHEGIREYVTGFRDQFSDSEMTAFEAQGRQAIIDDIPSLGIEKTARLNAAHLLIPLIARMGFNERDITIRFRTDFTPYDLKRNLE